PCLLYVPSVVSPVLLSCCSLSCLFFVLLWFALFVLFHCFLFPCYMAALFFLSSFVIVLMWVFPCLALISPSWLRWRLSRPALLMLLSIVPIANSILPPGPKGNQ